jgi:hypothetical protein
MIGLSSYRAITAPIKEDTHDLEQSLKQMPAFIEEAICNQSLKGLIATYLSNDAIAVERAITKLVDGYLHEWVSDQRRRSKVYVTDTEILSDGIRMFREIAKVHPIGLPAERVK